MSESLFNRFRYAVARVLRRVANWVSPDNF
jgi:hypothetical protein